MQQLQKSLPAWTLIMGLSGAPYFPEEKIAYEEEALRELCRELNIPVATHLPGIPGYAGDFSQGKPQALGNSKKI